MEVCVSGGEIAREMLRRGEIGCVCARGLKTEASSGRGCLIGTFDVLNQQIVARHRGLTMGGGCPGRVCCVFRAIVGSSIPRNSSAVDLCHGWWWERTWITQLFAYLPVYCTLGFWNLFRIGVWFESSSPSEAFFGDGSESVFIVF